MPFEPDYSVDGMPAFGSLAPVDPDAQPVAADKGILSKLAQTWPVHLAKSIAAGAMAPGDVYSGKMEMPAPGMRREDVTDIPGSAQPIDDAVGKMTDLGGVIMGGAYPLAPKGAVGSAGGHLAAPAAEAVVAPPFYSAVEQALAASPLTKAPAQQWMGTLKNTPGVKPDEIAALRLEDFLKDKRGAVTKDELLGHVAANKVQVGEKDYGYKPGGPAMRTLDDAAIANDVAHVREHGLDPTISPEDATSMAFITHDDGHWAGDFLDARSLRSDVNEGVIPQSVADAARRIEEYHAGGHNAGPERYRELDRRVAAGETLSPAEMAELARLDAEPPPATAGKFSQYVLPGGENYREKLLTLPTSADRRTPLEAARDMFGADVKSIYDLNPEQTSQLQSVIDKQVKQGEGQFRSSHYPDDLNTFAHLRMNDRTIDGERALHLEEIQSDWHQKGRKEGYSGPDKTKEALLADGYSFRDVVTRPHDRPGVHIADRNGDVVANGRTEADALAQLNGNKSGVPDAPFKTSWHELAFKRALREAAEGGYSRMSWTPGEAQALRYPNELRKAVKRVEWKSADSVRLTVPPEIQAISNRRLPGQEGRHPNSVGGATLDNHLAMGLITADEARIMREWYLNHPETTNTQGMPLTGQSIPDGHRIVTAVAKGGGRDTTFFTVDPSGKVVKSTADAAVGQHISDVIGKDMASKIMEGESGKIEGKDFVMGAEGMKGFYDQMLPKYANKLLKPYGSKVEQVRIGGTGEITESAARRLEPSTSNEHQAYGVLETNDFHFGNAIEDANHRVKEAAQDGPSHVAYAQDVVDQLEAWKRRLTPKDVGHDVHSVKITPELRKAAMEKGFPLFVGGALAAPVFGSLSPSDKQDK